MVPWNKTWLASITSYSETLPNNYKVTKVQFENTTSNVGRSSDIRVANISISCSNLVQEPWIFSLDLE